MIPKNRKDDVHMCRVIMTNKNDFNIYDKKHGMLTLMNHLEKECGGHGNGYALIKDRRIIESRKGVKLTNEQIYQRISKIKWDYLVYHTRITSVGTTSDANCHPFVMEDDCLAMNGTEYTLRTLSNAFNRTDTEVIFRNLTGSSASETTKALLELSSVFIGSVTGVPFVVKAGGTLHKWNKGNLTMHCSTFPASVPSTEKEDLPVGYIWENGKENRQYVKARATSITPLGGYYGSEYYRGYGYWDDDYMGSKGNVKPATTKEKVASATPAPEGAAIPVKEVKGEATPTKKKKKLTAYDQGYENGYEDGYTDGINEEMEINYKEGYEDGLLGREFKYNVGALKDAKLREMDDEELTDYKRGWCDGRGTGYEEGYEDGYISGISEYAHAGYLEV